MKLNFDINKIVCTNCGCIDLFIVTETQSNAIDLYELLSGRHDADMYVDELCNISNGGIRVYCQKCDTENPLSDELFKYLDENLVKKVLEKLEQ